MLEVLEPLVLRPEDADELLRVLVVPGDLSDSDFPPCHAGSSTIIFVPAVDVLLPAAYEAIATLRILLDVCERLLFGEPVLVIDVLAAHVTFSPVRLSPRKELANITIRGWCKRVRVRRLVLDPQAPPAPEFVYCLLSTAEKLTES